MMYTIKVRNRNRKSKQMQMEEINRFLLRVNTAASIAIRIDSEHLDTQGKKKHGLL